MNKIKFTLLTSSFLLAFACVAMLWISFDFKRTSTSSTPLSDRIEMYDSYAEKFGNESIKLDRDEVVNFVEATRKIDVGGEEVILAAVDMNQTFTWTLFFLLAVHLITLSRYIKLKEQP